MTTAQTAAEALINQSMAHNEIAWGEYDADIAAELLALCDDSVEASGLVVEFWGTSDDVAGGESEWRVHLRGPRPNSGLFL